MNIWTALFLVLSVVILASPFLSSGSAEREDAGQPDPYDSRAYGEDDGLRLDLASGRLAREDYDAMTGNSKEDRR